MASDDTDQTLPAGSFSGWLAAFRDATDPTRPGNDIDVPCGECTACCRASQFVHVAPDETETLAAIPPALLFSAPGHSDGTRVMGFDAAGCCPMLQHGRCSIYHQRPRTCRRYDCRVFAAAGRAPKRVEQSEVAARAMRWRFDYADQTDRRRHAAIRRARTYLSDNAEWLPDSQPRQESGMAALAIALHEHFLDAEAPPADSRVRAALAALL